MMLRGLVARQHHCGRLDQLCLQEVFRDRCLLPVHGSDKRGCSRDFIDNGWTSTLADDTSMQDVPESQSEMPAK